MNTDKTTVKRSRFEKWVSSPPFERSVERNPNDERVTAWPGQYRDIAVELAWLAWCESVELPDETICDGWSVDNEKQPNPSGFSAMCNCGVVTGAIDATRMDRSDVAKWLGEWLVTGKTVRPHFGKWSAIIEQCKCIEHRNSRLDISR